MEPEACKTRNSSGQESGEKSTECSEPSPDQQETIDPRAEKEAVRRADWIILPITFLYSFLSHLDRSNLGNARVAGLQEGLAITDYQFSIALTTTFVPYIAAELPVNLLLKKIGANIMIPLLVTIWGLVTTFQGFVYNYEGLLAARFFLGAVEGGLYPATVLFVSNSYKRKEVQFRIALFSSASALSGALSGVFAYWLIQLDGVCNIPGWGWIFIIEGIFTTICGILGFFIFPRSLATCKFLTPVQRRIMTIRMEQDRPVGARSIEEKFTWYQVYCALKSPHVLLAIGSLFMVGSNLYGLAYFEPSIVKTFGHSARMTQLVSVPPFAVGFFAMLSSAYFSDRYEARGITAVAMGAIAFAGYLMFMISTSNHYRYISLFLSTAGIYSASPTMYAWIANNSAPHYRKAAAIALGPIFANTGGILSTWLFPSSEEPRYQTATIVNLCL
ncbi:hypothetical protein PCANC_02470 [Puccinia coronata f. sp. avenae]|uniref:Major facilitator superfamily (MFS) profile domain-containing protein n=1 Tax=Puccinia coronata f. sp. avenae TaxID=200324 RepID=A0A2N5W506_9BASI|nr:hypothetical protein PCASD_19259 [Puccinia coronata f. sp. avenae]PLW57326.1 hypothetical protein PCANC_02470 [Puccinia coronata f. sp. avenae]